MFGNFFIPIFEHVVHLCSEIHRDTPSHYYYSLTEEFNHKRWKNQQMFCARTGMRGHEMLYVHCNIFPREILENVEQEDIFSIEHHHCRGRGVFTIFIMYG